MSDGVLAAIIAAGATVFGSFIQFRTSLAKEISARARSTPARKANHVVLIMLVVMLLGAAVGGFALAQWVFEGERAAQQALVGDLRDRIDDFTRYKNDIEQSRAELRSVVRTDVLRRMGADGVEVLVTAAPCKPPGREQQSCRDHSGWTARTVSRCGEIVRFGGRPSCDSGTCRSVRGVRCHPHRPLRNDSRCSTTRERGALHAADRRYRTLERQPIDAG